MYIMLVCSENKQQRTNTQFQATPTLWQTPVLFSGTRSTASAIELSYFCPRSHLPAIIHSECREHEPNQHGYTSQLHSHRLSSTFHPACSLYYLWLYNKYVILKICKSIVIVYVIDFLGDNSRVFVRERLINADDNPTVRYARIFV